MLTVQSECHLKDANNTICQVWTSFCFRDTSNLGMGKRSRRHDKYEGDKELETATAAKSEKTKALQNAKELNTYLEALEKRWAMNTTTNNLDKMHHVIKSNLLHEKDTYRDIFIDSYVASVEVASLQTRMLDLNCEDNDDEHQMMKRVKRLHECVHYCGMAALLYTRAAAASHPGYEQVSNDDQMWLKYDLVMGNLEAPPPLMQLVLYMLHSLRVKGYRRYEDQCYEMIMTAEGQPTRAWKHVVSIESLAHKLTCQDVNRTMMANVLSRGDMMPTLVNHLCNTEDWRFPDLVKDRRLMAFRNGLYMTVCDGLKSRFWSYADLNSAQGIIPSGAAACKYFDQDFPVEALAQPWKDIPTPAFQKILSTQQYTTDTDDAWKITACMYVMLGRLLHEVGVLDNWQCVPYIKGTGDTGKSTIITSVVSRFYEHADIGRLDNNTERQWCLSSLYDKLLFVAPEIKRDFKLEQAE